MITKPEPRTGLDIQNSIISTDDNWEPATRSRELFEILILLTTGEAKTLIRDAADGFKAWHILNKTYSRKTLARTLRVFKDAINPKPCDSIRDVISRISEWESKVADLYRTDGRKIDSMIKLAALSEICTPELRDLVYQQIDTVNLESEAEIDRTYLTVKEKVISWASNRVSSSMYTDVNIGNVVQCQPCEAYDYPTVNWSEEYPAYETEFDVNMMGKCYGCGGVGHPQRLCPTNPKGQGKGQGKNQWGKGFQPQQPSGYGGKGFGGKGTEVKGYGKGHGKATGKGFQGNCHNCGKKGHRAAECRGPTVNRTNMVEAETENAEGEIIRDVGGVWHWGRYIGNVEKV